MQPAREHCSGAGRWPLLDWLIWLLEWVQPLTDWMAPEVSSYISVLSNSLCVFLLLSILLSLLFFLNCLWIKFTFLRPFIYLVCSVSVHPMLLFAESPSTQTDSNSEGDEWAAAGWKQGLDPGRSQALCIHQSPRIRGAIASFASSFHSSRQVFACIVWAALEPLCSTLSVC